MNPLMRQARLVSPGTNGVAAFIKHDSDVGGNGTAGTGRKHALLGGLVGYNMGTIASSMFRVLSSASGGTGGASGNAGVGGYTTSGATTAGAGGLRPSRRCRRRCICRRSCRVFIARVISRVQILRRQFKLSAGPAAARYRWYRRQ